jgi:hypothetical protein
LFDGFGTILAAKNFVNLVHDRCIVNGRR